MALLQIAEPGEATTAHQHRLAVGIDLGTTNSLVATVRSGDVDTLPDADGNHLLPSIVHYAESEVHVGVKAQQFSVSDPLNTIVSVKRFMGRGAEDVKVEDAHYSYVFSETDSAVPRIKTRAGDVSAVEISAEILKQKIGNKKIEIEFVIFSISAAILFEIWPAKSSLATSVAWIFAPDCVSPTEVPCETKYLG